MKYCPTCHISYADDSQTFCFQDGTMLLDGENQGPDTPTVVLNKTPDAVPPENSWPKPSGETAPSAPSVSPPKNSNTLTAVLLTVLIMLVFFGFAGVGIWAYFNGAKNEHAQNSPVPTISSTGQETQPSPVRVSPTPLPASNTNSVPPKTDPGVDPDRVKNDVQKEISSWRSDIEARNFETHMSHYTDTLDYYYRKGSTSLSEVRKDKQRAFSKFDDLRVTVSNMLITPDLSEERATAVFDKEWTFSGPGKYNSGKVRSQLLLKKINGRWLIAGEKDSHTYYVNR
jgi:ketosteroid isomerase-like protein